MSTVITANHVVEGASRVDVILDSNVHERYPATVVKRDHVRDIAVLSIPVGNRRSLALMDPKHIAEGTEIAVIGYPRAVKAFEEVFGDDLRPSVHVGIVSAVRLNGELIQFDAQTDHGDSGGPVIDKASGAVIGIVRGILLDPSYSARGIEQALPGSNFGMSVATIDEVLNGNPESAGNGIQVTDSINSSAGASGSATASVASAGTSSAAYRVGYGAPHYEDQRVETISQSVLTRLSSTFSSENTFYMIPVRFGTASANGQVISGLCDDNRLNAIVQPGVFWSAPRVYLATGAPAELKVDVTLLVTDCSGEPFFAEKKTKTEGTRFSHRTVDLEIVDMANDLLDQLLADFNTSRSKYAGAWDSLLRTGIGLNPSDEDYHSLFYPISDPETHSLRVIAVFTGGPAANAGMMVGDVIESVGGQPVVGMSPAAFHELLNKPTVDVVVNRPGGSVTLTIKPEKYDQLISSLKR